MRVEASCSTLGALEGADLFRVANHLFLGFRGTGELKFSFFAVQLAISAQGRLPFRRILVPASILLMSGGLLQAQPDPCRIPSYDCALRQIRRGEATRGVEMLQVVLRKAPDDVKALNLMGIALSQLGRLQDANSHYRRALERDPGFYPAMKNLARNEMALGRPGEAKKLFQQVLQYAPEDEVSHLALAEIHFGEQQWAAALRHYRKVRAQIERDAASRLNFSYCLLQTGQHQEAIAVLQTIPAADAQSQFKAGLMLSQAEAYEAAARHFGLAQEHLAHPYSAGFNRVLASVKAGASERAIQAAEELFAKGFRTAELYSLISQAYLRTNQVEKAYDALRNAIRLEPAQEDYYVDLAALCFEYSNFDVGIEVVNVGLRNRPGSSRLYLQRGLLRAMKGQMTEAERDLQEAARLAPQMALPRIAVGTVRMQSGRVHEAVEAMRAATKVEAGNFFAQYMLARALVQSGVIPGEPGEEEAYQALQVSIRLNRDFWHSRAELGKLLFRRGEIDRAIVELEHAVQLEPEDVAPFHLLAGAYRRKGNLTRAEELMDRVSQVRERMKEEESLRAMFRIVAREVPGSQGPAIRPSPN